MAPLLTERLNWAKLQVCEKTGVPGCDHSCAFREEVAGSLGRCCVENKWWGLRRQGFPSGWAVNCLPAMQETQETWIQSLNWEDGLEEGMATHSSILAWRIPWTEEPGGLQSMGLQGVWHNWSNWARTHAQARLEWKRMRWGWACEHGSVWDKAPGRRFCGRHGPGHLPPCHPCCLEGNPIGEWRRTHASQGALNILHRSS